MTTKAHAAGTLRRRSCRDTWHLSSSAAFGCELPDVYSHVVLPSILQVLPSAKPVVPKPKLLLE